MRIAYLDCFSGISGDMCLGALVSAGWPAARVSSLPERLGLEGVTIEVGEARRGPFTAARVEVRVEGKQPHRHLHHVEAIPIARRSTNARAGARPSGGSPPQSAGSTAAPSEGALPRVAPPTRWSTSSERSRASTSSRSLACSPRRRGWVAGR